MVVFYFSLGTFGPNNFFVSWSILIKFIFQVRLALFYTRLNFEISSSTSLFSTDEKPEEKKFPNLFFIPWNKTLTLNNSKTTGPIDLKFFVNMHLRPSYARKKYYPLEEGQRRRSGAQEKTRTSTALRPLAPEASASTNSATWAGDLGNPFATAWESA